MENGQINKEFLLRTLMENLSDSIYFKDRGSRFIKVNLTCAKKHGWSSPEEIVGETDFDVFTKEHAEQAFSDEQRIMRTGEPMYGVEEKETWPDGSVTWASTTKMPLKDHEGKTIGTFGITRDITERKEAELRAARYAEEMRMIKEDIEEDVQMAAELQKNFFPSSYPAFPEGAQGGEGCVEFLHRFNLCRPVSGDYCAITKLSDHEVGLFQCDISGVGIRAALGTALMRGVMQEVAVLGRDPSAYLAKMNELLLPLLKQEGLQLSTTACYAVLDVATGRIRMASAAHPPPLHFRNGSDVKWLFENLAFQGPALATEPGVVYPEIESKIEPSDVLVLYTDGIYTVENTLKNAYGEKRLLGSANSLIGEPLEEIFDGLEGDALSFSHEGKFADDVCLVGLELRKLLEE